MNDSKTSNDSGKSKHKKKVSFSIFEISTFEELAKLRKMREEELDDFVTNKKHTNQYLTNLNQRNKILSMSNNDLLSFDNNDKNNQIYHINKNMRNINNKMIIPRPLKREENSGNDSYFYNQENLGDALKNKMALNKNKKKIVFSSDEEDFKSNDIFTSPPQYNSLEKNEIIDIDNIHSPINKDKDMLNKDNIFSPTSNDYNLNTNNNVQTPINMNNNIMLSDNYDKQDNIENEIINDEEKNEENKEENENSNELITFNRNKIISNNNNSDNENKIENNEDNNNNNDNNINNLNQNENEKEEDKEDKENNNEIKENENYKNIENENINNIDNENIKIKIENEEQNITVLFNLLEKIFQISPLDKINLIQEFFNNIFNYLEYQYDLYIDYEMNDSKFNEEVQEKTALFHHNIFYNIFFNNVKEKIAKRKIYEEHKLKAKKYSQYINYKYKIKAFNSLLTFCIKQKEWIKSIQICLMKKMVWGCLDSLKLYANYKKIKNYLRIRKKKKIFDVLRNNKQLSIQLLKNGRKLSLIFEYRHFFNNCRKKILAQKGKEINDKIVNEFRKQNLMRGIFNLLKKNHDIKKEKKNIYNNMIMNRNNRGKDFINIKVTRKETVKYYNGNTQMKIQNKINIV